MNKIFCKYYHSYLEQFLVVHAICGRVETPSVTSLVRKKNGSFSANYFYPAEFTPDGVLSSLYSYVRPYVRPKFFLRFLVFWDPHVGSS